MNDNMPNVPDINYELIGRLYLLKILLKIIF